jgi:hypothetical protein
MSIAATNSTVNMIRTKVRRLTSSSSQSSLPDTVINQYIQTFANQDLPYTIKLDQMRSVYKFYTRPYIDRYPLDINFNQGVRDPVYVDGIRGNLYKSRDQFYNIWPRWPTKYTPTSGDGTTTSFNFTIQGPFLSNEVTLGCVSTTGEAISVADDGNGNLQLVTMNPVVSVPVQTSSVPGMKNINTENPGQNLLVNIGTVNYISGTFTINFALGNLIPAAGSVFTLWVCQYQPGKPYSILYWNNELTIRPVPMLTHKMELETYLTPVEFMEETDVPIITQWWQYIAYGAACEILRDRQDADGLENCLEGFYRQEAMVLERQGVEEIGQRNVTVFSGTNQQPGWGAGWLQGGF